MFQNSIKNKQDDKICSISNFSNDDNSNFLTEQQINTKVKKLTNQQNKHTAYQYTKPVFIISQNLKSRHINELTQLLQKHNVPLQFQHQTDSLGQQLNTAYFVIVDNKNGTLKLGKQFNSPLMTIVGYPKQGNNKKNIYCQQPQQVFQQYKLFINSSKNATNQKYTSNKYIHSKSKLKGQQSMMRNGSILNSQISGLKLKSISKYDKKLRQNSQTKSSTRKFVNSDIFKSSVWQNKQNLTSIRQIYNHNNANNLYFIQSEKNQQYNNLVSKYYYELKLINSNKNKREQNIFYYRCQKQILQKLQNVQKSSIDKNKNKNKQQKNYKQQNNNKQQNNKEQKQKVHFIIINSQSALKLVTRINSEFYDFKNKIKLIVVMINQNQNTNQNYQQSMFLIQKTIQSNLFQSLVCSEQQCQKCLKNIGFNLKHQNTNIKVTQLQCKSILTKSCKKINNQNIKPNQSIKKQQISKQYCPPKLKNTVSINQKQNQSRVFINTNIGQKDCTYTFSTNKGPQYLNTKSKIQNQKIVSPRSKIIIPPINSLLSPGKSLLSPQKSLLTPQKSSVSSNGSKIKFVKVLKKQPSNLNPSGLNSSNLSSSQMQRNKAITDVNSQYCINKNKSIVEKLQSKIISSKQSLSSRKSIKSVQRDQAYKQQTTPKLNKIGSNSSLSYSRSKMNSSRFVSRKSLKDKDQSIQNGVQNEYQCPKQVVKRKVKKLKMNLNNQEPFVTRFSRIACPDNQSVKSGKKIKNLKKQAPFAQVSANQYYFGQTNDNNKKQQQQNVSSHNNNIIDGLIYVEYNEFIGSIIINFKQKCPSSIILKQNFKPFYLSCEYSRQLKKIWRNNKQRSILPSLIDIQGLKEIYKYYSNVMYEDDQLQFISTVKYKNTRQHADSMEHTGKFSLPLQYDEDNPHFILFFTIISQKQSNHQVFQQLDKISDRLPKHEVIKCIVEQNMSDKQMKQKSIQIYNQMLSYFIELKEQYGDRFIQTV